MIDLSKFKKVSSDKHTTTMRHDDGHELKVVHSVLSPKLKKGLEKLPMADGGEVPVKGVDEEIPGIPLSHATHLSEAGIPVEFDPDNQPEPRIARPVQGNWKPDMTLSGKGDTTEMHLLPGTVPVSEGLRSLYQPVNDLAESQSSSASQAAPEQPSGVSVLSGPSTPPQNPLLQQVAQATAQDPSMAPKMQQALQQNIDQQQNIAQSFQQHKQAIDAEHAALVHDITNNHIDMSDYWKHNDKGAAALGALLGGMGSGLTHLANPVPGIIANSQENFLKAELANQDNPKSLLSAVQAQYGNNRDAADVMRLISNEALSNHLQKVMAPLNSATAQAQGSQVQLSLLQNSEALKQQIAMRQALQSPAAGQLDPSKRILLMQRSGMLNDKQYEQANKELGDATAVEQLRGNLHNSYNDLNQQALAGALSPRDRQSAVQAFAGQLEHAAVGRFNLQEATQLIDAIMPKAFEAESTRVKKLQRLDAMMDGLRKTPTLDGLGIDVGSKASSVSPQQQAAMQWLQANPNDPRAPAVQATLQKQGVR